VVIIARHLAKKEVLDAFAHQVRLIRGRFGSYEPIDFLALLIGYAISGERTLADFFERPIPFGTAFMALFGRHSLPHRSSLSRFLAGVDRPCLEAFRTLFEQSSFAEGWTNDSLGGIWDRHGLHYLVFDVDATRQAARQRALPHDPTLPRARRRQDGGLCARLHGAKTRGGRPHPYRRAQKCIPANGSAPMQAEAMATIRVNSKSALQAITTYLKRFALPPEVALVRLDGQYGDVVALAQLLEAGVYLVTRARGYQVLEHPQMLRVLAYPPTFMPGMGEAPRT
jgi:hypothetical protein